MVFFFNFYSNFDRNSGDPDQTSRSVASDLDLHCLPTSHKKGAMLTYMLVL